MRRVSVPDYKPKDHLVQHVKAIKVALKEAISPGTATCSYPRERRLMPDCFRGYILFDPELCISCFSCAFICPANAVKMKDLDGRYYPAIDYAKCIFCHFCIDSCPEGALRQTKIHDVAYKDLDRMLTLPEEMVEPPEILREDSATVEYLIEDDLRIKKKRKKDDLFPDVPRPPRIELVSFLVNPENCLGCRICEEVCPQGAISSDIEDGKMKLRLDEDKCTGCGLCVRECRMDVLRLGRRDGK
ncbi:MAG: 4Fe-4S binding protein [Candidatus Syntropharchaeales archaeon]